MKNYKKEWFSNVQGDILGGIVVFMALIPEVMGFCIVAGVDPMVGVYASFCMTLVTAFFGGRPGLISAAAGSMALVLASLVKEYGIEYMFAATILTGILQVILGYCKVGNLLKFVPRPVMLGFVNALGIMMFQSQIEHFTGSTILIVLVIIGIAIIYLFPKVTKKVPSPIISIAIVFAIVAVFKIDVKTLGDMGSITSSLPRFVIPNIPFTMETFQIIFPYAISLSIIGMLESLLTAQLVDDMTDTTSDKNQECVGQGLGNVVSGFFGGIAGCGMIGQTMVNMNYGGRGRLSSVVAGSSMLVVVIACTDFVAKVPVVALAAVMVVVSVTTIDWKSFKRIRQVPVTDAIVMLTTVIVVLLTHNLAYGVLTGVVISALFFAAKVGHVEVTKHSNEEYTHYEVTGQLFFASATSFIQGFDYAEENERVIIDFSNTKIWDESAVEAIDKVVIKLHKNSVHTQLVNLSPNCHSMVERMATHNKPGGLEQVAGH